MGSRFRGNDGIQFVSAKKKRCPYDRLRVSPITGAGTRHRRYADSIAFHPSTQSIDGVDRRRLPQASENVLERHSYSVI